MKVYVEDANTENKRVKEKPYVFIATFGKTLIEPVPVFILLLFMFIIIVAYMADIYIKARGATITKPVIFSRVLEACKSLVSKKY